MVDTPIIPCTSDIRSFYVERMGIPLSPQLRQDVADDIRAGELSRNAIARKHHISAGSVTNIARAEGLWFENDWMTAVGTEAHRVDCEIARLEREGALLDQYMALTVTNRLRDGQETRAAKKLSYALYNIDRHHSRR